MPFHQMKFPVVNTGTGQAELFEVNSVVASTALGELLELGLRLTITHTQGKLSYFAIQDSVRCDFDFELFNYEPDAPQAHPYFLANMLQRFTREKYERWRKQQIK